MQTDDLREVLARLMRGPVLIGDIPPRVLAALLAGGRVRLTVAAVLTRPETPTEGARCDE